MTPQDYVLAPTPVGGVPVFPPGKIAARSSSSPYTSTATRPALADWPRELAGRLSFMRRCATRWLP